ncbi:RNA polymerase subunit sigma-24 [Pseudonocardia sp. TMWB2A]|uniref:RNA polymerase sigma factor n=2 Tax=Pseudonocardia TaxID=1847 RepID=UPI001CF6DE50|nr:RNA polymerase sigma factor [Pseudonocardia sp. ICBG162]
MTTTTGATTLLRPLHAGDTAELLERARAGDEQAFRALWAPAHRQAHALCLRLTGNRADADDALQDTQIAVWQNLDRFDGRCPFTAWVQAIARNAARSVLRARSRRPEPVEDLEPVGGAVDPFAGAVTEVDAVQRALGLLPGKHREALLLRAGDLSYEQIAALMGATPSSVRVWVHRGRLRLAAELGR